MIMFRRLPRALRRTVVDPRWVIELEQTYRMRRFGAEYQQYRSRARRWIWPRGDELAVPAQDRRRCGEQQPEASKLGE